MNSVLVLLISPRSDCFTCWIGIVVFEFDSRSVWLHLFSPTGTVFLSCETSSDGMVFLHQSKTVLLLSRKRKSVYFTNTWPQNCKQLPQFRNCLSGMWYTNVTLNDALFMNNIITLFWIYLLHSVSCSVLYIDVNTIFVWRCSKYSYF
jgi:hypothetical protein